MIEWLQKHPLVAVLAGLGLVLILAIGVETGFGTQLRHPIPPPPAKPAAAPDAKLLPPVALVSPEQAYPETTTRPLFVPTRRPAPVEATAKNSFERGQYVLQGVIMVGDQRTALLKEKASGRVHRVDKGKDVNGVVVESVEPTRVTLAVGPDRETLNLTVQKPGGEKAGAPQAQNAPAANEAGGPFAAAAGAAPVTGAATPPNAAINPPQAASVPGVAPANAPSTAQRAVTPGATGQPMTPEELLARRRARRNQPTQ